MQTMPCGGSACNFVGVQFKSYYEVIIERGYPHTKSIGHPNSYVSYRIKSFVCLAVEATHCCEVVVR
jgi:hypothetical protein